MYVTSPLEILEGYINVGCCYCYYRFLEQQKMKAGYLTGMIATSHREIFLGQTLFYTLHQHF